jgi:hypothetical protein
MARLRRLNPAEFTYEVIISFNRGAVTDVHVNLTSRQAEALIKKWSEGRHANKVTITVFARRMSDGASEVIHKWGPNDKI